MYMYTKLWSHCCYNIDKCQSLPFDRPTRVRGMRLVRDTGKAWPSYLMEIPTMVAMPTGDDTVRYVCKAVMCDSKEFCNSHLSNTTTHVPFETQCAYIPTG